MMRPYFTGAAALALCGVAMSATTAVAVERTSGANMTPLRNAAPLAWKVKPRNTVSNDLSKPLSLTFRTQGGIGDIRFAYHVNALSSHFSAPASGGANASSRHARGALTGSVNLRAARSRAFKVSFKGADRLPKRRPVILTVTAMDTAKRRITAKVELAMRVPAPVFRGTSLYYEGSTDQSSLWTQGNVTLSLMGYPMTGRGRGTYSETVRIIRVTSRKKVKCRVGPIPGKRWETRYDWRNVRVRNKQIAWRKLNDNLIQIGNVPIPTREQRPYDFVLDVSGTGFSGAVARAVENQIRPGTIRTPCRTKADIGLLQKRATLPPLERRAVKWVLNSNR